VHDANGPVLAALLRRDGADVCPLEYLSDDPAAIRRFLQRDDADLLLLCGGTSVGPRDFVAATLRSVGSVAFHGLPIRPGRPVGIGETATATAFLLPGNPIACQFTYELLVGPLVRGLAGRASEWPYRRSIVRLTDSVASQCGRLDYLRVVRVETTPTREQHGDQGGANRPSDIGWESNFCLVRPLTSGRASNLTSVSEADGFVFVPIECERLSASDEVVCYWFDECDFRI
jgi:molybdopterin molybdotransferase